MHAEGARVQVVGEPLRSLSLSLPRLCLSKQLSARTAGFWATRPRGVWVLGLVTSTGALQKDTEKNMNSKATAPSNRKFVPALVALLLLILPVAGCGAKSNSKPSTTYPFLSEVTLLPSSAPSITVTGTVQVAANGGYQVSSNEVDYNTVTSSATWSTSNAAVATVDKGLVTGTGIGSATISASLDGKTGKTLVVVGQTATLDISADTGGFSLSAHPDQQFKASASYSDGSVLDLTAYATWKSSAPGVLKFYDDPYDYVHNIGEAALLATGTTTITATLETAEVGSWDVTVVP